MKHPQEHHYIAPQLSGVVPLNSDFYMTRSDADKIMDPHYWSEEIAHFIEDEKTFLKRMLDSERYDCIVEVGCHQGQNAHWLSTFCDRYVGIDLNQVAIQGAQAQHTGSKNIAFHAGNAETIIHQLGHDPTLATMPRKLVLFPFNLAGNFINLHALLATLDRHGFDLVLSSFNDKSKTTVGRYRYYENIFGGPTVRVWDAEQGVLFRAGQVFQSIAFSTRYLSKIMKEAARFHGVISPFSTYGNIFLFTK